VAGDFENQVKEWIEKYFGPIEKGEVLKNKRLSRNR
jgi:hypothetical protein